MGRIILTIVGPWDKPPAFETPLAVEPCGAEPRLNAVFADLGGETTLDARELRAIEAHRSLIQATAEFEGPGSHAWARQGAELVGRAFAAGASGVYVETGAKVFGPGAAPDLSSRDPVALFHLFVEVRGDASTVGTEGMQAFDLPEVEIAYGPTDGDPAQAAAFGLAARMVCDRFRPVAGGVYRNTESAPLYRVSRRLASAEARADPYVNAQGAWLLQLA